ncbi:MAG: PIN domain-containing protein [Chloroflexi bacterium]|nr:PIN domain-containing protein [Chloroflexota bacterium]
MARLIIDSSALIALERSGRSVAATLEAALADESAAIASITVSELLAGVYRADSQERRLRRSAVIQAVVERLLVLPFDLRAARVHAEIWAQLTSAGQRIGSHDMIIAATALAYGYEVVTYNLREFQRVPGLTVRQPSW